MEWTYLSDIVGMIGVSFVLFAFYLLQSERVVATDLGYLQLNVIGSALLLFSLFFDWNLSAVIVEAMWLLISLWGVFRALKQRRSRVMVTSETVLNSE